MPVLQLKLPLLSLCSFTTEEDDDEEFWFVVVVTVVVLLLFTIISVVVSSGHTPVRPYFMALSSRL